MKICGLDPGNTGGMSILSENGLIVAIKTPITTEEFVKNGKKKTRKLMDLEAIRDFLEEHQPHRAVLEKVAARTGQGVTSMFRFGTGWGQYQGILAAMRIPFIMPTPQAWKKHHNLIGENKDGSLDLARTLWPDFAISAFKFKNCDGVAESALIAKYGFDHPELFQKTS